LNLPPADQPPPLLLPSELPPFDEPPLEERLTTG
jgi:hypothetical protein